MAEQITAVSPSVLKWARTSLGLKVHEVAEEMGKDQDVIERWEDGAESPTYAQLERLAYTVFKRPIAIFFLPEPPHEVDVRAEFRTYLGSGANKLDKDTLLAVRDARVRQLNLEEFHDSNTAVRSFLGSIHTLIKSNASIEATASAVRNMLGVTVLEISQAGNASASLDIWRSAVEAQAVFVFKRAFKQENVSGFCLRHDSFPLIYLNNKTSFTRQTFTLVHELCHLAFDVSGVCAIDLEYTTGLQLSDKKTEEYCDAFAAEVLVPRADFLRLQIDPANSDDLVSAAKHYRVSPAVISRKCYDLGLISYQALRELMALFFHDNWRTLSVSETKSGGDYYNTQLQYLSKRYLTEAHRKHARGQISDQAFAEYLGVKVSSLAGIEGRLLGRQSGL
ncbi:MAG: XRE family transcriptional regulator [Polaromonas sp.]|nr:XRE family transcriptional regulator [Polaromonas sp.]MDP3752464.1 XRE family transcriptional regulator [Polaromonas sp.]